MIKNGRLEGAIWKPARVIGGPIVPSLIVIHDTAGHTTPGSSVKWFQDPKCDTSAHFVVEVDGTIVQMVPCDRKANHCGASSWRGVKFCNPVAIGIEIVSPGKLDPMGKAWFGATYQGFVVHHTSEHGKGAWLPYTQAQIDAVVKICRGVAEHYPDVNEIVGHWQISPGRKVDPSPLFPWDEVRQRVFEPVEEPPPEIEPQKTMATSKEGNIQVVNGTVGAGVAAVDVQNVVVKTFETTVKVGKPFSLLELISNVLASPMFLVGLGVACASGAAWYFRAQKRWNHNI